MSTHNTVYNRSVHLKLRSRSWCFTYFNYTPELEQLIQRIPFDYLVYGHEVCPTTGRPHLQGYIYFKNARFGSAVLDLFPMSVNMTLLCCNGSTEENYIYATKDKTDIVELGTKPRNYKRSEVSKYDARKELYNHIIQDNTPLSSLAADGIIHITQVPLLKKAKAIIHSELPPFQRDDVCGMWIYGAPGIGKSHYVRNNFISSHIYIKQQNKWFDGYEGQAIILLEDLDTPCLTHYLKIWADKWPCSGEIKGGSVNLQHTLFVVTSNYLPSHFCGEGDKFDQALHKALLRRFDVYTIENGKLEEYEHYDS